MANRQVFRSASVASVHSLKGIAATKKQALAAAVNASKLAAGKQSGNQPEDERFIIKPSWKRWIVLFLYMLNSGNKAFQWIQLPASTQKLTYYYEVENYIINSTSTIFMLTYIFLTYPACFIIDAIGMRNAVLIGSLATAGGSLIRCMSCNEEYGIYLLFTAQLVVSLGEQLIFSVPSRLASVWFPDHQVSTAVGLSIFGNQMGTALGFLLPQYLLNEAHTKLEIENGLYRLYVYTLLVSVTALIGVILLFDEAPKFVPGRARLQQLKQELEYKESNVFEYKKELIALWDQMSIVMRKGNFILLATAYGINIGIAYAVATLLNQMLEIDWPGDDIFVGYVGFIIIITGVVGSLFWGPILDKTHKYLATNIILTILAFMSFLGFAYVLIFIKSQLGCYIAAGLYGIFQTGFIVAGLDLAVELTYPVPELVSSSLMNVCPQIAGIVATFFGSFLVDNFGIMALFTFFLVATLVALICYMNVKEILLRQEACRSGGQEMQLHEKPNSKQHLQIDMA